MINDSSIPGSYVAQIEDKQNQSRELKNIFAALAKAQGEMQTAGLDSDNPYFKSKYSSLAELVRASRPSLSKNGLAVLQQITAAHDGVSVLVTKLGHASGEWIQSSMRINPPKTDIQSLGSCITYLKRYCYASLIGVVTDELEDQTRLDDGNSLTTSYNNQPQKPYSATGFVTDTRVTTEQVEDLEYELKDYPDIKTMVLEALKIKSLDKMSKSSYRSSMSRIQAIKSARSKAGS